MYAITNYSRNELKISHDLQLINTVVKYFSYNLNVLLGSQCRPNIIVKHCVNSLWSAIIHLLSLFRINNH